MNTRLVVALVFVLARSARSQKPSGLHCVAHSTPPLKVSVNSRHNLTGHWVSKVGLERRPTVNQDNTGVDVEHFTTSCGEEGSALNIVFTFTASPIGAASQISTSDGYEHFPGIGVYKYHNTIANWTDAREVCAQEGAHLAIVNSDAESALFVSLFKKSNGDQWPWLGVHRIEDEFFTIFGKRLSLTGFAQWANNKPSKGSAYCVALSSPEGKLYDFPCNSKQSYVCEKGL